MNFCNENQRAGYYAELHRIKNELSKRISDDVEINDEVVADLIDDMVCHSKLLRSLGLEIQIAASERIFVSMRRDLGILDKYVNDLSISEIMVNGPVNVFIERAGRVERLDLEFENAAELEEIIRRICAKVHREINELNPIVDARLADGSRVNAVYKNVALGGPSLSIRKFPEKAIDMDTLIANGSITKEAADFLKKLVMGGYNIFISGGTSSGKTTFLNVLSNYIPSYERVVVIEDSAELQIRNIENLVRLECRNANVQGKGKVDMQALIKASLRMRPDRIIVGEVRGAEVMDMIQAMNTGHDGSLSTGHGNSVEGMLRRLESMFLQSASFPIDAIRNQIGEGIDIFVHLARMSDGSRKVLEIAELVNDGNDNNKNTLFEYVAGEGLKRTENELKNTIKLKLRGIQIEEGA